MSEKGFQKGDRLEAIDRKNPWLVCVANIKDIRADGQLLITFDGWSENFDYWCEPTTHEIAPTGSCQALKLELQPPKGHTGTFLWSEYLSSKGYRAAPRQAFTSDDFGKGSGKINKDLKIQISTQPIMTTEKFQVGDRLEAVDRKNATLVCVAFVKDIDAHGRLLISFDGWTDYYDYWCDPDTPEIGAVGTCARMQRKLEAPKSYPKTFVWQEYLNEIGARAAPVGCFAHDEIGEFSWSTAKIASAVAEAQQSAAPGAAKTSAKATAKVSAAPTEPVESDQPKDIFLSYSREPHVTKWVRKLKARLIDAGYTVWMDEEGIESGTNWLLEIGTAVMECKAFVAVMTNRYTNSKWCKDELFMAKQEGKAIFPIMLETIDVLKPDLKYAIGSVNWTHMMDALEDEENFERGVQKLLVGFEKSIGAAQHAVNTVTVKTTTTDTEGRKTEMVTRVTQPNSGAGARDPEQLTLYEQRMLDLLERVANSLERQNRGGCCVIQ